MFKSPVHPGLFFSPFQDPVSSIIFWGTNRFPNWVVFAVGPLKVFDRMGDQAKIHISLNVSLQNTMGSHAPFFYHAHFRSNEAGIGITRGTVSLSEFSAVIVRYHGTNLSGQHTMVWYQNSGNWEKFAPEFAPVNFPKNGFLPSTFRRPFILRRRYGST